MKRKPFSLEESLTPLGQNLTKRQAISDFDKIKSLKNSQEQKLSSPPTPKASPPKNLLLSPSTIPTPLVKSAPSKAPFLIKPQSPNLRRPDNTPKLPKENTQNNDRKEIKSPSPPVKPLAPTPVKITPSKPKQSLRIREPLAKITSPQSITLLAHNSEPPKITTTTSSTATKETTKPITMIDDFEDYMSETIGASSSDEIITPRLYETVRNYGSYLPYHDAKEIEGRKNARLNSELKNNIARYELSVPPYSKILSLGGCKDLLSDCIERPRKNADLYSAVTPPFLLCLHGPEGSGKRSLVISFCRAKSLNLFVVGGSYKENEMMHKMMDFVSLQKNCVVYFDNTDDQFSMPVNGAYNPSSWALELKCLIQQRNLDESLAGKVWLVIGFNQVLGSLDPYIFSMICENKSEYAAPPADEERLFFFARQMTRLWGSELGKEFLFYCKNFRGLGNIVKELAYITGTPVEPTEFKLYQEAFVSDKTYSSKVTLASIFSEIAISMCDYTTFKEMENYLKNLYRFVLNVHFYQNENPNAFGVRFNQLVEDMSQETFTKTNSTQNEEEDEDEEEEEEDYNENDTEEEDGGERTKEGFRGKPEFSGKENKKPTQIKEEEAAEEEKVAAMKQRATLLVRNGYTKRQSRIFAYEALQLSSNNKPLPSLAIMEDEKDTILSRNSSCILTFKPFERHSRFSKSQPY